MAPPRFLLNSCDNSQDPIVVMFDISKEDLDKIEKGEITSVKIEGLGCFTIVEPSMDPWDVYTILGLYKDCFSCLFSDAIDEFKLNQNVSQKFDTTRSEVQTLIENKLGGKKS